MLLLFVIWKILYPDTFLWLDLSVGIALFLVGFVAWLLKGLGAGDAKLFFVAGIFSGYQYAGYFAVFLFITGLAFLLLMLIAKRLDFLPIILFGRIMEIGRIGKIPYGVPLALATIGALIMRLNMSW